MKKNLFLAALAFMALASCTSDEFVGDVTPPTTSNADGAISFNSSSKTITRADHVGADAAGMLGEKFYVGGYKYDASASNYVTVFDNYKVEWDDNTAGTTTDNTSDWKYVGVTNPGFADHISGAQTIKYWDNAAEYYDFVAYSPGKGNSMIVSGDPSSNNILATAINPNALTSAAYTLTGSATDLAECYIADMVTAKESGASTPDINYRDEVSIKFRSLGSKVRVALYETIPGYSVRDVNFYTSASATSIDGTSATLFTSDSKFYPSGTMTVYFPNIGSSPSVASDYNKAHVTFAGTGTATSTKAFGNLNYEATPANWEDSRLNYDGNSYTYLKRTSTDPSFAGTTAPYYLTVLPDETGNVLELRVDYTLESIDGNKETITVHGATAFVPQIYAAWKPNYAYTYIFKISDNTNGWTKALNSGTAGLYPITFDAVVADSEDGTQSTITTVSAPSITTYMKGHKYTDGPEYKVSTSDSIYVMVMDGNTLKSDLNTKGKLYTLTAGVTEANVMDALNIQASASSGTIVGRNGITLTPATEQVATGNSTFGTIPGADGNPIIDIEANTATRFIAAAGTYAYVYDYSSSDPEPATSEIHTAVVLSSAPDNWATVFTSYYEDEGCTKAAPATFPTLESGQTVTYYQKYINRNHTYAVKVIKVASN